MDFFRHRKYKKKATAKKSTKDFYVDDLEVNFLEEHVRFKKRVSNFPTEIKNTRGMLK